MITTEDMAQIISGYLGTFEMPIYVKGHIPVGKIGTDGRITLIPKADSDGKIFNKCFVEVNFVLPDVNNEADFRLDDIERAAYATFKDGMTGQYDGQYYNISYSRRSREEDVSLKCHYVHLQLLFETLNVLGV